MSGDEREAIRQALLKSGSLESLLQQLAQTESEESRKRRQVIEEGPDHPSDETLYHYVLGWLKHEREDEILDHILLCRACLEEVFRIRHIEDDLKEHVAEWADGQSVLERLKSLLSKVSFEMFIQFPALELARHSAKRDEYLKCEVGETVVISLEAPADGYMTVFHWHEDTGGVSLIFPLSTGDQPHVSKGQEISIFRKASETAGRQGFKAIWTKDPLEAVERMGPGAKYNAVQLLEECSEALAGLSEGEIIVSHIEYEVV